MKKVVLSLMLLSTGFFIQPVKAWDHGEVRITPYMGFMVGGDFEDHSLHGSDYYYGTIDLDSAFTWGVRLGFGLTRGIAVELQLSHTPTAFNSGSWNSFFDENGSKITDVDLYMLHTSLLFDLCQGPIVPYLALGIGTTVFDMNYGEDKNRFTGSFGGGIKFWINDYMSLRTEVRGYSIFIDHKDYGGYYHNGYYYDYNDYNDEFLNNLETTIALSFRL